MDDFTIPESVRNTTLSLSGWPFIKPEDRCWECGSTQSLGSYAFHLYCGGCRASLRQQARQDEAEFRRQFDDD